MEYAGKEVTKEFYGFHRQEVLMKYKRLIIGSIVNETPKIVDNFNGELSKVPYSEPASEMGFHSPYYQESHHRYRLAVRKFLQNILVEHGLSSGGDYDMDSTLKVHCELGKAGILAGLIGPGPHLKQFPQLGSVDVDEFDAFHEMILQEEFVTQAFPASGFVSSVVSGLVIGLPPLIHFGNDHMRNVIVPQVLSGQKKIVLAISEPFAGSDVAQIKTTARKTADGKHYIVNGVKKWITGGPYTDYFTAAVRTGSGNGPDAISMLLIERSAGVETKPIKSSKGTDTAYVILENVMVPVENLLGNEGEGFKVIMFNFNHERWGMVVAAATMVIVNSNLVSSCYF
jgi:alkylation response protein AidB-like acyl-CoA dehydrogenase